MSNDKGRENDARDLYRQARFRVQKFYGTRYGDKDAFGLFDLICLKPGRTPRFVQVSTNANGRVDWLEESREYLACGVIPEYLQVYSGEGWRLFHHDTSERGWHSPVDEREIDELGTTQHSKLNMGDGIVRYLENPDND